MATGFIDLLPAFAVLGDPARSVALSEVAAAVGLSPSRAQRVITAAIGESPKAMDRRIRLDVAAIRLMTTDDTVLDIALATGFASHEGFTRAFADRFGQPPSVWRARRRSLLSPEQAELVLSTSRCVRLHHRSTDRKDAAVTYAIEIENLDAVPVVYRERVVDRDQVGEALAEILPAVFEYVIGQGLAPAGHPFVRYLESSPAFVTIQAGIPLVEPPPTAPAAELEVTSDALPAGPAAVTIHHGPYDGLGDAHAALDRWIAASEHTAAGAPWELYLTDPGEVPDPADWQTKVCWPIT